MTPQPVHPDAVKPLGGGIKQRFVKSRWGWYVHTTHNCFIIEVAPFAFTRAGIDRKAKRLARRLHSGEQAATYERVYDAGGRPVTGGIGKPEGGYLHPYRRGPRVTHAKPDAPVPIAPPVTRRDV